MEAEVRAELTAMELRIAKQYATRAEVDDLYEKTETIDTIVNRLDERLKGIEGSVNRMSGNFEKLFWAIITALLLGVGSVAWPL